VKGGKTFQGYTSQIASRPVTSTLVFSLDAIASLHSYTEISIFCDMENKRND
jgi:hypothetical protein